MSVSALLRLKVNQRRWQTETLHRHLLSFPADRLTVGQETGGAFDPLMSGRFCFDGPTVFQSWPDFLHLPNVSFPVLFLFPVWLARSVVKQRMQMYNSPYRGVLDCMRCVWQQEGALAFYRSYTTQLTMNVPFQALHFMTYEYLQELLNPQRQYNLSSHMVSGALAGAIAAATTTPLDVCKTLLNTQESLAHDSVRRSDRQITGLGHAFRTVYRLGGLPAYFKGVQARVIYQMPSTAISWSVYEFFKYVITKHQHEKRKIQRDGEK